MAKGLRFNKGKNRIELIPTKPIQLLGEVYTRGAHKYSKYKKEDGSIVLGKDINIEEASKLEMVYNGADNWRNGLSWTEAIGSVERHINAYKNGEDMDPELGTYHLANAAWGLFALLEFYKTHPELDDRNHRYLKRPRIGLDIDNVICDWTKGWGEYHGLPTRPEAWQFHYGNRDKFKMPKEELEAIYKTLPRQCEPHELPFEPCAYLTARGVDQELTKAWLEEHKFPTAPVFTVPFGASKVEVAKQAGIEWFIDDSYDNFVELNNAGICCFLFDAPHNRRYNVGYKRIMNFEDFKQRFL